VIDPGELSSGTYFYEWIAGDGDIKSGKLTFSPEQ
jgi:hypothetical protein